MIKHVVMFQLKDKTPTELQHLRNILHALPPLIPQLRHMETGVDVLHSPRSMDLALITHFDNLADLKTYATHPEHLKVAGWTSEHCSLIKAVDFEF